MTGWWCSPGALARRAVDWPAPSRSTCSPARTWTRPSSEAEAIDLDAGITTSNLQEAQVERAMINAARRVVVVADRAAWGTTLLSTVSDLSHVAILVTDAALGEGARRELNRRSVQVCAVDPVVASRTLPAR